MKCCRTDCQHDAGVIASLGEDPYTEWPFCVTCAAEEPEVRWVAPAPCAAVMLPPTAGDEAP